MLKNIYFLLILCPISLLAQDNWELKKEANDIKIFTRATAQSNLNEFKATTLLAAPMETVLNEILDAPAFSENHEPGVSYYLKSGGPNKHIFYARKELPWPIKDRDIITQLTVKRISKTKIKLCLESLPDAIPSEAKTLRIKKLMGHWLLEAQHGKTLVTQQLFVDPEGTLPPLITNSLLIKGPFKTFSELQEAVEK